ncbi:MAG TPA: hypothetical protein VFW40_08530 [Capsulimonadaceae bacterium]|nr:hypothetical protein [Capsulimonadaceae bacterium]
MDACGGPITENRPHRRYRAASALSLEVTMYQHPGYDQKSAPSSNIPALIAAGVLVLVVLAAVFLRARARQGVPLTSAPGTFTLRLSDSKVFMCDVPKGWTVTSSSDGDMDDVTMADGDVSIDVSLANVSLPDRSKPLLDPNDTSDAASLNAETSVQHFHEITDQKLTCPIGPGDIVDFTGDLRPVTGDTPPKTGPVHGLSANIVTQNQNHATVLCYSPPDQWNEANPVFYHMLHSLSPGPAVQNHSPA